MNSDLNEMMAPTQTNYRGPHQHGRDPAQYGNMFNDEEFGVQGTTTIKTYQQSMQQPPQRQQPLYMSEFANRMTDNRRFKTPERSDVQ